MHFTLTLTLILILSATNFQSLAILRLQLCGHKILFYPMQDRHLHFLRNAGLFKHLVGDIPVALISLVLLYKRSNAAISSAVHGIH